MYVLIINFRYHGPIYVGPFPSVQRAQAYADAARIDFNASGRVVIRCTVEPMIQPYQVVTTIEWRERR